MEVFRSDHRLNMEVDLQSLFSASCHVMCTGVLIGWDPATGGISDIWCLDKLSLNEVSLNIFTGSN